MKKLLLSGILAFTAVSFTQAQTWNISDVAAAIYSTETVVDGLTLAPAPDKTIVIDASKKNVDDYEFTQRLKLAGAGAIADAETAPFLPSGNYLSFDVAAGKSTITIYGISPNKTDERSLIISNGVEQIGILTTGGENVGKSVISYDGVASKIYLYSAKSGFNLYYIAVTTEAGNSIATEEANKAIIATDYYDLVGRKITEDTKGLALKKLTYEDGTSEVIKVTIK